MALTPTFERRCVKRLSGRTGNLQHNSSDPVLSPVVPVQEAVIGPDGALIWRICAGPHCVEAPSGAAAWQKLRALCRDIGITLAATGVVDPTAGPSPVPDPGV